MFNKNTLKLVCLVAISLFSTKSQASSEFVYAPELTGYYAVGATADKFGGTATLKETVKSIQWTGGVGPKFMTYEISGVLGEPIPLSGIDEYTKINFNGRYVIDPRPGVSWGSSLNENQDWTIGAFEFKHSYDKTSGNFYFGLSMNVYDAYNNPCCQPWSGDVSSVNAEIGAVFYNNYLFSNEKYLNTGFVYIESARVGLSDVSLQVNDPAMMKLSSYEPQVYPYSLTNDSPANVPAPLPIFGAVAALGWSRKLRRRVKTRKTQEF